MTIPDERLMAYVDGELEGEARAEVERAIAGDTELARRVAREQSLRGLLRRAYDPVLKERVPDRLLSAVRAASVSVPPSNVVRLRGIRSAAVLRWSTREWTAIAASLIVGALVSALALRSFQGAPVSSRSGQLIARGALASALSTQLASRQTPDSPVAIGVTFMSRSGDYCRTFTMRDPGGMAGLACHDQDGWRIEALARSEVATSGGGAYRPAASSIPQPVLDAAAAAIVGDPLDTRAEAAAQASGWKHR